VALQGGSSAAMRLGRFCLIDHKKGHATMQKRRLRKRYRTKQLNSSTSALPTSAKEARQMNVPYYRAQGVCANGHRDPIRLAANRECRECKLAYKRRRYKEAKSNDALRDELGVLLGINDQQ
jgi:hypothetical protein